MEARVLSTDQELVQGRKFPVTTWPLAMHLLKAQDVGANPPQLRPHDLDAVNQCWPNTGAIVKIL
jgi:hypothetical protein